MKFFIKQFFISYLLLTTNLGGCGDFSGNYEEIESSVSSSTASFVAVGDAGVIYTSSSGTSWASRTSGTSFPLRGVTYGNSTFMAVGLSGTILSSSDGISWTSRDSATEDLYKVTYSQ